MKLFLVGLCLSLFSISIAAPPDDDSNESMRIKMFEALKKKRNMCRMSALTNKFGFDMQKEVSENNNNNMIFSPFSIYAALGMLSLAARGKSKKEIVSALKWHKGKNNDKLQTLQWLQEMLSTENSGGHVKIEIANNGWVANNIHVLNNFQTKLKQYFGVKLGIENFKNPEVSREKINNWVSQHTGKLINDLFPRGAIDGNTMLVLANAIYFKGSWKNIFNKNVTYVSKFYQPDGTIIRGVSFMYQNNKFKIARYRNVQFLEMPYLKDTFTMLFAMPMKPRRWGSTKKDFTNINALINEMDYDLFKKALSQLKESRRKVDVHVPKFTIKQGINLKTHLRSLGVNHVFNRTDANLSGINGIKMLYVTSAVHKAFVQVDELGTKAGAATGIGISVMSIGKTVRLNRPFLFFILNKSCNTIMFAGKITNPL